MHTLQAWLCPGYQHSTCNMAAKELPAKHIMQVLISTDSLITLYCFSFLQTSEVKNLNIYKTDQVLTKSILRLNSMIGLTLPSSHNHHIVYDGVEER